MPALTTVPDAERPIGAFITDRVLPRGEFNAFRGTLTHTRMVTLMLQRRRVQVHPLQGIESAYLYNGNIVGGGSGRLTTLVSDQAFEACGSKNLTRQYLAAADVPVPEGRMFAGDQKEAASLFLSETGPWVIKPDTARRSRGVSFGVTSKTLEGAWSKALNVMPGVDTHSKHVLIEKFHDALCVRFYVVGGIVRAATARVPLFVVGDGGSTVSQLVESSFEARKVNPLLRQALPRVTDRLLTSGEWSLDQVPVQGELALLSQDGNLALGGLPVDVTAEVHPELNDLAVHAINAIPGLGAAGVDILTPQLDSAEEAVVLDADAWANTKMHRYPALGRPRRTGAAAVAEQIRLRAEYWDRPVLPPEAQDPDDD